METEDSEPDYTQTIDAAMTEREGGEVWGGALPFQASRARERSK